jgi:hypothetical protein
MVDPDRIDGAARRGRVIAGRFQIHHLEIMAGRMLDQHRLVENPEVLYGFQKSA